MTRRDVFWTAFVAWFSGANLVAFVADHHAFNLIVGVLCLVATVVSVKTA